MPSGTFGTIHRQTGATEAGSFTLGEGENGIGNFLSLKGTAQRQVPCYGTCLYPFFFGGLVVEALIPLFLKSGYYGK
ncbi:MAG: hypothetical protein ONB05_10690 [candidate division KSB1 bacterium]|nr:hypothetical protein [candidate division KSB1 bacterium]